MSYNYYYYYTDRLLLKFTDLCLVLAKLRVKFSLCMEFEFRGTSNGLWVAGCCRTYHVLTKLGLYNRISHITICSY